MSIQIQSQVYQVLNLAYSPYLHIYNPTTSNSSDNKCYTRCYNYHHLPFQQPIHKTTDRMTALPTNNVVLTRFTVYNGCWLLRWVTEFAPPPRWPERQSQPLSKAQKGIPMPTPKRHKFLTPSPSSSCLNPSLMPLEKSCINHISTNYNSESQICLEIFLKMLGSFEKFQNPWWEKVLVFGGNFGFEGKFDFLNIWKKKKKHTSIVEKLASFVGSCPSHVRTDTKSWLFLRMNQQTSRPTI